MSREEALNLLQNGLLPQVHGAYYDSLNMAIEALQQQPCEIHITCTDEDRASSYAQIDLTRIVFETLAECGIYGEEATIKFIGTLKRLGRSDLLPPCAR